MPVSRLNPVVTASSKTATDTVIVDSDKTGKTVPPGTTTLTKEETARIDPYNPNSWGSEGTAVPYTPNPAQQTALKSPTSVDNQAGGILTQSDRSKNNVTDAKATGKIVYKTSDNQLHQYNNYTYGISLHALKSDDYKKLTDNPKSFTLPKNSTLISSASRHHATRSEFFTDDFYFEDLKLTTVIGLNAISRSSNAIEVSFTIIEPYGMTLINRLLDLTATTLGIENYLQVPYLLEIDFFAYNDAGAETKISKLNKKIPIRLTGMKMRASVKGTEYQVTAVPFNHQANFQNTQAVKTTVEVTARTVGDYLNDVGADSSAVASAGLAYLSIKDDAIRASVANQVATSQELDPNAYAPPPATAQPVNKPRTAADIRAGRGSTNSNPSANTESKTGADVGKSMPEQQSIRTNLGFAAAYNAWYATLLKNGDIKVADEIYFNITSDSIKNSILVPTKNLNNDKVPFYSKPNIAQKNDTGKSVTESSQENSQTFVINAGTSIQTVIEQVITNSEYITKQLKPDGDQKKDTSRPTSFAEVSKASANKDINWFKVVPMIELKQFDKTQNAWGKKITFIISEYTLPNTTDDRAVKSQLPNPVKDYQYLYTGKNRDVISFDLDFNTLFFTALQVNRKDKAVISESPGSTNPNKTDPPSTPQDTTDKDKKSDVTPTSKVAIGINQTNSGNGNLTNPEAQKNTSFRDNIYNQIGGDMLNLKLNILGDPDFIKQDDILYTALAKDYKPNQQFTDGDSGSLVMDRGVIFCRVTFNTPADIDTNTGGLRYYQNKKNSSSFSGLYQITKITSEFRQGKFLQVLEGFRQRNQPGDSGEALDSSIERDNGPIKKQELADAAKGRTNNINLKNAQLDTTKKVVTKDNFKTPPTDTLALRDAPELDPGAFGLQRVVETAPTVAIANNSANPTGEQIIGYTT